MLAMDGRIERRGITATGRAVARIAGGDAFFRIACAEQTLPERDLAFIGFEPRERLAGVVRGEIRHVRLGQRLGLWGHERVLTGAALECLQLLDDVLGVLTRQAWPLRIGAVAIHAMAGNTGSRLRLAGFRRAFGQTFGHHQPAQRQAAQQGQQGNRHTLHQLRLPNTLIGSPQDQHASRFSFRVEPERRWVASNTRARRVVAGAKGAELYTTARNGQRAAH